MNRKSWKLRAKNSFTILNFLAPVHSQSLPLHISHSRPHSWNYEMKWIQFNIPQHSESRAEGGKRYLKHETFNLNDAALFCEVHISPTLSECKKLLDFEFFVLLLWHSCRAIVSSSSIEFWWDFLITGIIFTSHQSSLNYSSRSSTDLQSAHPHPHRYHQIVKGHSIIFHNLSFILIVFLPSLQIFRKW